MSPLYWIGTQVCYRLSNWSSLRCLGPSMNHVPPVWRLTFMFMFLAANKQLLRHLFLSVCLSVRLSHLFQYVPIIVSSWNYWVITIDRRDVHAKVKVRGQRSQRSWPHLAVSGALLQFEFSYGNEMMHKASCCLEEVPYCFFKVIHQIARPHG